VSVDGDAAQTILLHLDDDVLVRILLGTFSGNTPHTVTATHADTSGLGFYFDFFELAVPTQTLPVVTQEPEIALATDWDTDHSIALAPERTAWIINSLGFVGRTNHYAGALWFYELEMQGNVYASATASFTGTPSANSITTLYIGDSGSPDPPTAIHHLNLVGDTAVSIAKAFELELNSLESPSESTCTASPTTLMAVSSSIA